LFYRKIGELSCLSQTNFKNMNIDKNGELLIEASENSTENDFDFTSEVGKFVIES
jgi:hypothetical protein